MQAEGIVISLFNCQNKVIKRELRQFDGRRHMKIVDGLVFCVQEEESKFEGHAERRSCPLRRHV